MDFAIFMVNIPTVKEYRKLNLSEEQGERFHQDIKTMDVRYNEGHGILGSLLLSFQKVSM
jgi:hypothetical protein